MKLIQTAANNGMQTDIFARYARKNAADAGRYAITQTESKNPVHEFKTLRNGDL